MPTTTGVPSLLARLLCLYVRVVSFYLSVSVSQSSFLTVIFRLAYGVIPSASVGRVRLSRPVCFSCTGSTVQSWVELRTSLPCLQTSCSQHVFSRPLQFFSNICCVLLIHHVLLQLFWELIFVTANKNAAFPLMLLHNKSFLITN